MWCFFSLKESNHFCSLSHGENQAYLAKSKFHTVGAVCLRQKKKKIEVKDFEISIKKQNRNTTFKGTNIKIRIKA